MSIEGYNFLGLQNEVLEHQFSEGKYRSLVKTWLNQAQVRVVLESEIRTQEESDTISTEASAATYALPSDFARIIDLYNTENHELLTPLGIKEYDALPTATGTPYSYTVIGSNIVLYPTPDGVYSLAMRYWKLPNDMSADEDTPSIPAQYQELLIAYAMKKAFLRENDYQSSQVWEAQWEKGILKMRGEVVADTFDGPRQVGGSWGDEHGAPYANVWWH